MRDEAAPVAEPRGHSVGMAALACDAHCHIYGLFLRFPLPRGRSFTPLEALEAALRRLHGLLGFGQAVIVQSQGYGFDHGPMPDDGELVGLVAAIAPSEVGRRLMLVDNPARFFGFGD